MRKPLFTLSLVLSLVACSPAYQPPLGTALPQAKEQLSAADKTKIERLVLKAEEDPQLLNRLQQDPTSVFASEGIDYSGSVKVLIHNGVDILFFTDPQSASMLSETPAIPEVFQPVAEKLKSDAHFGLRLQQDPVKALAEVNLKLNQPDQFPYQVIDNQTTAYLIVNQSDASKFIDIGGAKDWIEDKIVSPIKDVISDPAQDLIDFADDASQSVEQYAEGLLNKGFALSNEEAVVFAGFLKDLGDQESAKITALLNNPTKPGVYINVIRPITNIIKHTISVADGALVEAILLSEKNVSNALSVFNILPNKLSSASHSLMMIVYHNLAKNINKLEAFPEKYLRTYFEQIISAITHPDTKSMVYKGYSWIDGEVYSTLIEPHLKLDEEQMILEAKKLLAATKQSKNLGSTQLSVLNAVPIAPANNTTLKVALKSLAHAKYLGAQNGGGAGAFASNPNQASDETFTLVPVGQDKVALRTANGHYLVAEENGSVNANRTAIGPYETFTLIWAGENKVALLSTHLKFVVAEENGNLNANRDEVGPWETFELSQVEGVSDQVERRIALRSFAHSKYVGAQNGGGAGAFASNPNQASDETLTLLPLGQDKVAFRTANGHYLVAEENGSVNANRTGIGPYETFTMEKQSEGVYAFRSHHGFYLVAEENGDLNANRPGPGPWEKFYLIELN